jgi:hypothetical protein
LAILAGGVKALASVAKRPFGGREFLIGDAPAQGPIKMSKQDPGEWALEGVGFGSDEYIGTFRGVPIYGSPTMGESLPSFEATKEPFGIEYWLKSD